MMLIIRCEMEGLKVYLETEADAVCYYIGIRDRL